MAILAQVPLRTTLFARDRNVSQYWAFWLTQLRSRLNLCPERIGIVSLTAQSAAITATAVSTPVLHTGLYRISSYIRITTAATTSSSATLTVGWTDRSVSCSESGAAITGNTTTATQSGSRLVQVDSDTTVTYAVAYASTGATAMQYALDITVEEIRP